MKHLHLDCFVGISGDMTLAALIDLGVDAHALEHALAGLQAHFHLHVADAVKAGIRAADVTVALAGAGEPPTHARDHAHPHEQDHGHDHAHENGHHHAHTHDHDHGHAHTDHAHGHGHPHEHPHPHSVHEHHHHHHGDALSYTECLERIANAGLPDRARDRALRVLRVIGEAEASVHGVSLDQVHFHELGGVDTLVDICGACVALEMLGVETVSASPLPLSHGFVTCAHGVMPVPPPATAKIAEGMPVRSVDIDGETVTPTGAGLVKGLADSIGPVAPMRIERIGHGAGKKDFDPYPNVLRVLLGETDAASPLYTVVEIKTQVDDCTAETIAYAMERALEAGAVDAFAAPVHMKKGRVGAALTVLSAPEDVVRLSDLLMRETSTIGVRLTECRRTCLPRREETVQTPYGAVRVKVVALPDGAERRTPEYDDCARLARESDVPLTEVYAKAMRQ